MATPPPRQRDISDDIVSEIHKLPGTDPHLRPADLHEHITGPVETKEPPTGRVATFEVIAHPAPLWRRLGATLIDAVLLGGLFSLVARGVMLVGRAPHLPDGLSALDMLAVRMHDSGKLMAAIAVMSLGIGTAYTTLFGASFNGRTVGRLLFGIYLVDGRGHPPSPTRALIRALFAVGSYTAGLVGFWWSLFDRKGQGLHDKLCATFVVRFGARRT
jgi:uncharacterized RDD family membrane protein YckC